MLAHKNGNTTIHSLFSLDLTLSFFKSAHKNKTQCWQFINNYKKILLASLIPFPYIYRGKAGNCQGLLHEKKYDKNHILTQHPSGFIYLRVYNMVCRFEWYYFCFCCCFFNSSGFAGSLITLLASESSNTLINKTN